MKSVFCLLTLGCLLAACGGGSGGDNEMNASMVSKGQELIDLQKARDANIITNDEYQDQKEDILDRSY